MSTLQEQLREAMKGIEIQPRRNLEGVTETDTDQMLKFLGAETETEQQEGDDDAMREEAEAQTDAEPETEAVEEGERDAVKLTDLADMLEWTPEAVYAIQMPMGDGETITLGEAKDRIKQASEVLSTKEEAEQELAEARQALETGQARLAEQLQMAAPGELIRAEAALQRALDEYNRIDWVGLETSNPGQAALTRQKLVEQVRLAQMHRDDTQTNIEQARMDLQKQREAAIQQFKQQQMHELHRLIPEWSNPAKFTAECEQLVAYGISEGMDEALLRNKNDPKEIYFLYRMWKEHGKREGIKPVQKPPKMLKPQVIANRQAGRKANVDKQVTAARGSKDMRVKQSAVAALLRG